VGERRVATLERAASEERAPAAATTRPAERARQLPLPPAAGARSGAAPEGPTGAAGGFGGIAPGWLDAPAPAGRDEPDPLARRIGEAITARRQAAGLSQTELAQAIGCNRSAISRWEMGTRLPALPHLLALGRALGCGAGALLPE
jgi:DNA-binding XRE family transcriptional regulator